MGLAGEPLRWELTGVPVTSMRDSGGIADAIHVLRSSGLAERLAPLVVMDAGDLELEAPSGERGPSGLLKETALGRLVEATRERVRAALRRGRRALLVGGDCPVLLGALAALGDETGEVGLVMLDGHEDAWPPSRSETGEASDSELGIALGIVGESLPAPLDGLVPLVASRHVALFGPRDGPELAVAGVRSIRDDVAVFATGDRFERGRSEELMVAALETIAAETFWLHVDLDVLSSEAFPAVDYPQPGGLGWEELDGLAVTAARDLRCRGASIVIYNPDLDPDRSAASTVVDFACRLVAGSSDNPTRRRRSEGDGSS
jgi:arginase